MKSLLIEEGGISLRQGSAEKRSAGTVVGGITIMQPAIGLS